METQRTAQHNGPLAHLVCCLALLLQLDLCLSQLCGIALHLHAHHAQLLGLDGRVALQLGQLLCSS